MARVPVAALSERSKEAAATVVEGSAYVRYFAQTVGVAGVVSLIFPNFYLLGIDSGGQRRPGHMAV